MSAIGMRHIVVAPVTTDTPGAAIVYGTGAAEDHAVRADVNFTWAEGTNFANDVVDDYYKFCTGADVELEATQLEDTTLVLMGLQKVKSGSVYKLATEAAVAVGFGFVQTVRTDRTTEFRAYWVHKVTFSPANINAQTMQDSMNWQNAPISGKAWTVYLADNEPEVVDVETFETYAAATAWLDGLGNV